MKKKETIIITILLLLTGGSVFAGSLQPTSPPTAGTMKSLDQVEPRTPITSVPFTITQSGSYYLTKNLTSLSNGIIVEANDVTIDLCGFTLTGPGSGSNYGINIDFRCNVEIRNGTIRKFGLNGVWGRGGDFGSVAGNDSIIGIKSISNGCSGIYLYSTNNIVKDCTVNDNGASSTSEVCGIYTRESSKVIGNIVSKNGSSAVAVTGIGAVVSTVTGNTIYRNGDSAAGSVYGIISGNGTLAGNTIYSNGASAMGAVCGIYATGSTITDNTVENNGDSAHSSITGIQATHGSTVKGNTVSGNGNDAAGTRRGISMTSNSLVDQNTVVDNGDNIYESGTGNVITANNVAP